MSIVLTPFKIAASKDSVTLHGLVSAPQSAPVKSIVQICHGMCEHKERYIPFMEFLSENGYVCVIHDHRGHGESVLCEDDLGFMYDGGWSAMVEDVKVVSDYIKTLYPGLKMNLFGHSMGSMVVRSYVKRYDREIDSLTVCGSPSDNPAKGMGKALAYMFGVIRGWHYRPMLLQNMSFGAFNKPFEKEGPNAWVCSDPETLDAYRKDPLCSYIFTSNGFYNLMGLMADCYSRKGWNLSNGDIPVHFIVGENDPCKTSMKAFESAVSHLRGRGFANVDSKVYPGMRHEILNETLKSQVWNDVLGFLV